MAGPLQPEPDQDSAGGAEAGLVHRHLGLVGSVARRFRGLGHEHEDLFQIGCIGLVKAAARFDPAYGTAFSTYAVPLILGEIRRFLRDDGPVRISRGVQELARKARQAEEALRGQLGREATAAEVAAAVDAPLADVVGALDARRAPVSLSEPASGDGDGPPPLLADRLASETPLPALDDRLALQAALEQLRPRDRSIIVRRYFLEETQAAVAAVLGVSQVQVSRLERQALTRLRLMLSG